jgi:hypothetical protein
MTIDTDSHPTTLRPVVCVSATYRELGPGVESIDVRWDEGTYSPGIATIVATVEALRRPIERDPLADVRVRIDPPLATGGVIKPRTGGSTP